MHLKTLGLEHFRCYQRVEIDFGPGLHFLLGDNASGKTSVLEAIHLLAMTKSHRTATDRELIAWNEEWARATGVFQTQRQRELSLRVTLHQPQRGRASVDAGPRKTVEVNAVPRRRLSDIIGQVAVVVFGPDDLSLIKGPPSVRRHFLNAAISQVRPPYLADLVRYRRALRQRNECLKRLQGSPASHELVRSWDGALIEAGARVATARADFVHALSAHVHTTHYQLSDGREEIELRYAGDLAEARDLPERQAMMREWLTRDLERDIGLGRTLRGPQRDELHFSLGGKSLRTYGSQGQQRTAALSLSLAEARVVQDWCAESPIVLLDDCLSELDEHRARRILELTSAVEQMIITTATWAPVFGEFTHHGRTFAVRSGRVEERAHDGH